MLFDWLLVVSEKFECKCERQHECRQPMQTNTNPFGMHFDVKVVDFLWVFPIEVGHLELDVETRCGYRNARQRAAQLQERSHREYDCRPSSS